MVLRAFGTVGGYKLIEELGRGSYGAVYRAQNEKTGETVALKLLSRADDGGSSLERFRREGELLLRVPPHPNLVRVKAAGEHDGLPFIAMELIEGRALDAVLKEGPLSPDEAGRIVERVALALDHLHRSGVVHRDVTAKNVLMDPKGRPRLVDFGLALDLRRATRLTNTESGVFGCGHLAPEQILSPHDVGPLADVYGAASLLYTLLAGKSLNAGVKGYDDLVVALKREKADLTGLPESTPVELVRVLEKALSPKPAERHRSAAALARAIDLALGGEGEKPGGATPSPEEAALEAGQRVGPYMIAALIGQGSGGTVYEAIDGREERVALKLLAARGGPASDERFRREAKAASRLEHPGIVRVHGFGEAKGVLYHAMDLVRGRGLDRVSKDRPLLPIERVARLGEKIARALHAAHEQGVLHRAIKPSNVFLGDDGEPRLADFGLALFGDEISTRGASRQVAAASRSTDTFAATAYLPPEQADGRVEEMGRAADVYSLAAVLFELASGEPPFRAGSSAEMLHKIANEPAPSLMSFRKDAGEGLDAVLRKALAKKPAERYASANDFAEDLALVATGAAPRCPLPPRNGARDPGWGALLTYINERKWLRVGLLPALFALFLGSWLFIREREASRLAQRANEIAEKASGPWARTRERQAALAEAQAAENVLDFERALGRAEQALTLEPGNGPAQEARARALLGLGRLSEGREALARALARRGSERVAEPGEAMTWIALVDLRLLEEESRIASSAPGPLETAVQAAEKARGLDEGDLARLAFVRAILSAGRLQEGKKILDSVSEPKEKGLLSVECAAARLALRLLLKESGDSPLSIEALRGAPPAILGCSAALLLKEGHVSEARDAYLELTKRFPGVGAFRLGLARVEAEEADFAGSLAHVEAGEAAKEPAKDEALRARVTCALGKSGETPRDARGFLDRARLLAREGDGERATAASREALAKLEAGAAGTPAPRLEGVCVFLAGVLGKAGKNDEALEVVSRGLKNDPRSLPLLSRELEILVALGRFDKALGVHVEAERLGLALDVPWASPPRLMVALGMPDEAVAVAVSRRKNASRDAWAWGDLVKALVASGKYDEARALSGESLDTSDPKRALEGIQEAKDELRLAERLARHVTPFDLSAEEASLVLARRLGAERSAWSFAWDERASELWRHFERGTERRLFGKESVRVEVGKRSLDLLHDSHPATWLAVAAKPALDLGAKRELVFYVLAERQDGEGAASFDLSPGLEDEGGKRVGFHARGEGRAWPKAGWQRVRVPLRPEGGEWEWSGWRDFDFGRVRSVRFEVEAKGEGGVLLWVDGVHFE